MSGGVARRGTWPRPGARTATGSEAAIASEAAHEADLGMALIIGFVVLCALLGDRLVVGVSTGGRGALELLSFGAPAAAAVAVIRYGTGSTLRFLRSPVFIIAVAPYLVLELVLPVLGVMFNRYPYRTLISITGSTSALSFMVLGAAASAAPMRRWRPWLAMAIGLQLAYALGQIAYLGRGPAWELFAPFHAWDLSLQALYGSFVQARPTGLYFNPNELGLWAGVATILAWTILTTRLRVAGVLLAVLTLGLSQSRGASVALVAAACVGVVLAFLRGRTSAPGAARTAISVGVAALVAITVVVAVEPSQGLVDRFSALIAVWTQGPQADANLAGRLDYWRSVIDLNAVYPWGTWGSPELLLGTAVDSTWFRAFAQGSVPLVGALILLLVAPFALLKARFGDALVPITILIAVAGLTQTPLDYPIIFLYWALLGAALQSSVADRAVRRPPASVGPPGWRRGARAAVAVPRAKRRPGPAGGPRGGGARGDR